MESKFLKLRNELSELGYFQCFSKESVPLVEKLLADLKTTTQSLQKYMKIAQGAIEEKENLQLGAEPYKCDNAKLIKECNELHLAFIQFKEQHEKVAKDLKRQVKTLELEKEELESNNQLLKKRIKDLQFDLVDQGNIISDIKGKRPPTSSRSNFRSKSVSSTKSKIQFDFDNVMATAEQKISFLTNEIRQLKSQHLQLVESVESYQKQVSNRDKEIKRLNDLLEGGRSSKALNRDCCYKGIDNKMISYQEQVQKLKMEKNCLENDLKESLSKQHEAMRRALHLAERNKQLENELKDIDQIALAVEAQCNNTVKDKADTVTRLQDRINELVIVIKNLERENAKIKQDKIELSSDLDSIKFEKLNLQKMVDQLTVKINNFTIIENDLNLEIDRLVRISGDQKRKIAELENQVHTEKSKEYNINSQDSKLRLQAEKETQSYDYDPKPQRNVPTSPQTSRKDPLTIRRKGPTLSPSPERKSKHKSSPDRTYKHTSSKKTHKPTCKKRHGTQIPEGRSEVPDNSPIGSNFSLQQKMVHLQDNCKCKLGNCLKDMKELLEKEMEHRQVQAMQVIDSLKQEKEYYMKQYQKLMEQMTNRQDHPERYNDLMKRMNEHEASIESLKNDNKRLSEEKFTLLTKLTSSRSIPDTDFDEIRNSSLYKRKEREIEILRQDILKLEDERDHLKRKCQDLLETSEMDKKKIKTHFLEMEAHIDKLEMERKCGVQEMLSAKSSKRDMETDYDCLKEQFKKLQTELNHHKANYEQLKNIHDQSERALSDCQNQLVRAETESAELRSQMKNAGKKSSHAELEVESLKGDIQIMKVSLTKLDRDKDELLMQLDEKTEKNAALEEKLKSNLKNIACLESEIVAVKKKLSKYEDETMSKDEEIRSARMDMGSLQSDLDHEKKHKESAVQENRRLQDTINSLTLELKRCRTDLEVSERHVDDLKRQLQIYVAEIKRAEDLITQKEVDRTELLDQFKSLSQEHVVLETSNHNLESENNNHRVQLSVAMDHASDLERQLEDKEGIIRSYERQISDLTTQVASLEIQMKQSANVKDKVTEELLNLRDLCVKLDKEKDQLRRELQNRDEEKNMIKRSLERVESDKDIIQKKRSKEKNNVDGLEKLLTEARQDVIEQRLLNQDLQGEINKLKEKVEELTERLSATSEQLDMYQEKALDYSQQNKQLRRDIANERFFRAEYDDGKRYPSL